MPRLETYEQAIEFLYGRINYERTIGAEYTTSDFKLDRMRELLARLGDPQARIPVVHIAGTKGKGSTAAMTAGILTAAGYRAGLFTSPHISAFEERMLVDGQQPTPAELVDLLNEAVDSIDALDRTPGRMSPTYFEIATALAWLYFRNCGAQIVALEVGMGGRLDATNVCAPVVTVITTISRDHTRQLGSTTELIAREKAGIIKPGVPCVCGVTDEAPQAAILDIAIQQHAPVDLLGRDLTFDYLPGGAATDDSVRVQVGQHPPETYRLPLLGAHQAQNAALVRAAIERLREAGWAIPDGAIRAGFEQVRWPARIEVLRRSPTVIIDAAHNWAATQALLHTLATRFPARRRLLLFAATRDKDVAGQLRLLLDQFDTVILTHYLTNPRNVPVDELVRLAGALSDRYVHASPDPAAAWKLVERFATPDDLICVTGSFFIAAEIRELLQAEAPRPASAAL